MKKLCLSILAIACVVSSPLTLADTAIGGYTSTLNSKTAVAEKLPHRLAEYSTLILVTNQTGRNIKVIVPGAINNTLANNTFDYITSLDISGSTPLTIKTPDGDQFWRGSVCNHAIINVTNYSASGVDILESCR